MFTNLRELIASMPDEKTCREYVAKQRWEDGKPICPHCGHNKCYTLQGGKKYKCGAKTCYKKFSVTVGTVMEASNIPLCKWLTAIYLVTAHKKGISSYQLGKDIGVSQKSSWFMLHRIREVMQRTSQDKLSNIVEADMTFVGGKISNKSNKERKLFRENPDPTINKSSVLGILERQGDVIMQLVPKKQDKVVDYVLKQNISPTTIVVTDEGNIFGTVRDTHEHHTVNHLQRQYVNGNFHTNSIEGVFSHFKRMVYGIYHQISPKHTQPYLNEFTYRFNSRKLKDADRFTLTMQNMEGRLTYKRLIEVKEGEYYPKPAKRYKEVKENKRKRKVIQRKGDEVIGQYDSITDAAKANNLGYTTISMAIKRGNKSGGFNWNYA